MAGGGVQASGDKFPRLLYQICLVHPPNSCQIYTLEYISRRQNSSNIPITYGSHSTQSPHYARQLRPHHQYCNMDLAGGYVSLCLCEGSAQSRYLSYIQYG